MSKDRGQGGAKNHSSWPLGFDTHDPEGAAAFCLGLGYPEDDVVNTLVEQCNVDRITARLTVREYVRNQQQGGQR